MTTNKSIDGLSTRAAKTRIKTSVKPNTKSPARQISKPTQTIKPSAKISAKPTFKSTTKTSVRTAVSKQPTKKSTIPRPTLSEDFINAPTTNMWDSIKLDNDSTTEPSTSDNFNLTEEFLEEDSTAIDDENTLEINDFTEAEESEDILTSDDLDGSQLDDSTENIDSSEDIDSEDEPKADFLKPIQAFEFDENEGLTESTETVEELKNQTKDPEGSDDNNSDSEDSDDDSSLEPRKSRKEKKQKKPISKKRKIISITALVIVLILIGVVVWAILWGNDIIAKLTGGRGNVLDLLSFTSETYDPLKADSNGRTNILAFGTGGYDMSGEEGGGVHDGADLTDSIMLISFDQKTGDVAMLSLPRDLKGPATCTATGKINEVYWCNGGGGDATTEEEEAAASALMTAVGSILGVDIQYFAHLNWGSIISIVDTLGGINITLDEDILDYEYTGAVFEAGTTYTINGAQAVGLARARHGTMGGDFSRGASQQKIIIGIKDRILEKGLSMSDLLNLVSILGDNLRTNFSVPELNTLAHLANTLDFDVMRQISLYPDYMTTATINGISYVIPSAGLGNYGAIQVFVTKQLSSDPRDYEEPTIAIYNASDTTGLASEEKSRLETKGYTITIIDNAPAGDYPAGTTVYAIAQDKPGTKGYLEDDYNLELKPAAELPATIAPNYDFIIILNPSSSDNN